MACGTYHALALRADGTVVAWGENESGQTNVPPDLAGVIAVAAGANHSLALKAGGSVVAWGRNQFGECAVPPGVSYAYAVAGGSQRSVALVDDRPPTYTARATDLAHDGTTLTVGFQAEPGRAYFLEAKSSLADPAWRLVRGVAARGASAVLTDASTADSQRFYFVRMSR
jgi:hypothetical protein